VRTTFGIAALAGLVAGGGLVAGATAAGAAEAEGPSKAMYQRYCGACHGPEGKGDGIAGTFMRPKPTDLTELAREHGGEFPFQHVMEIIDGRRTVRAHGDPVMPVWGEVLRDQATWDLNRRAEVQGKLLLITDYLRTIQAK